MQSFITGSRIYGRPTEDSDIDLVVLVDEATAITLEKLSDLGKYPVRFGMLNLILCTNQEVFNTWKQGTLELKKHKDLFKFFVNREDATEFFDKLFESKALSKSLHDSGSEHDRQ